MDEGEVTDGSVALPGGGFAKVKTNENNFSDLALAGNDHKCFFHVLVKKIRIADADFENDPNLDPRFRCGLCSNVIVSAVSTPCCGANYCDKVFQKIIIIIRENRR